MRHQLFAIVTVFYLTAVIVPSATAIPYEIVSESGAFLEVSVFASDAFTNHLTVINGTSSFTSSGSGGANGEVLGTLDPRFAFEDLSLSYSGVSFAGTVGATGIPVSILISDVSQRYTNVNNGGYLASGMLVDLPAKTRAEVHEGSVIGVLSVDGVDVPFSFHTPDYCGDSPCFDRPPTVELIGGVDVIEWRHSVFSGPSSTRTLVNDAPIAEIDGIRYDLRVISAISDFDLAAVPEPSIALLMGLGLVGLGAAGKRK